MDLKICRLPSKVLCFVRFLDLKVFRSRSEPLRKLENAKDNVVLGPRVQTGEHKCSAGWKCGMQNSCAPSGAYCSLGHSGTQTIMQESFRKEVCKSCKHIFATNYYHASVGFLSACPVSVRGCPNLAHIGSAMTTKAEQADSLQGCSL